MESPQLIEPVLSEEETGTPLDEKKLTEAERAAQFELIKSALSRSS